MIRFNFDEGRPAGNFDTFTTALLTVFQVSYTFSHLVDICQYLTSCLWKMTRFSRVTSPIFDGKFALHECHACDVVHLDLRRCIMRCWFIFSLPMPEKGEPLIFFPQMVRKPTSGIKWKQRTDMESPTFEGRVLTGSSRLRTETWVEWEYRRFLYI